MSVNRKKWPEGVKRTRQRESVLDVLENADKPLCAADICEKLGRGREGAWLSTVYRILGLFVEKGIVVKSFVLNDPMALYEMNHFIHRHYAVCVNCHSVLPLDGCPIEKMAPQLEEGGFSVLGHSLEIYGYCKNCRESIPTDQSAEHC